MIIRIILLFVSTVSETWLELQYQSLGY